MRTRNFRVRHEVVERGAVTKSQKRKKAHVDRKVGESFQWKGDSCSFSHDRQVQGEFNGGQRRKGRSSSPAPKSKAKSDEGKEKTLKTSGKREGSSSDKRSEVPCRCKNCKNPSCLFWHLPVCQYFKSETWCKFGRTCFFRHVEGDEKPSKKSKKGGAKGSVVFFKEFTQLCCVSQDSYPRKSILRKERKLGSKHAVKFSKGTWHQHKIRERKVPSRGIIQECAPHERSPCAPQFEERTHEETLHQERYARKAAWNLAKNIYKLKNADKATFYTPIDATVMPAPTSKRPEER